MSNHQTRFTVLIERRAVPRFAMLGLALLTSLALLVGQRAQATPGADAKATAAEAAGKRLSRDLHDAIDAGQTPQARWARDERGRRMVQVVFVNGGADREMKG